ncbi:RND superfamily putative drug exporter [Psychromicrobium silvestre]|uniref:RND superfamily putative drug exporter n=1 Tax=Psychromicrobium silvestre TaxID=1645614 RepID=A0A7Y9LVN3_9MICC|nr:MMPL family transporter [Psychromicrobium silvestre]NYE96459.1 RND superfamily putative drug exporter [Psychromicrobium silvestre]
MALLLYRLGKFSAKHRWSVVVVWLVILLGAGGAAAAFHGQMSNNFQIPGTETQRVLDQLERDLPSSAGGSAGIVFQSENGFTAAQKTAVAAALKDLTSKDYVQAIADPFERQKQLDDGKAQLAAAQKKIDDGNAQLSSKDNELEAARTQVGQLKATLAEAVPPNPPALVAQYQAASAQLSAQEAQLAAAKAQLVAGQAKIDAERKPIDAAAGLRFVSENNQVAMAQVQFKVSLYSLQPSDRQQIQDVVNAATSSGVKVFYDKEITQDISEIFGTAEIIGVVIAAIVLMVMLGTLIAAGLPLVMAVIGVGIGVGGTFALTGVIEMSSISPMLALMLGLAVGIDYSLFIVNRHRQQLLAGMELRESIAKATGTSGNAVLFAGLTVVIALAALSVTGLPFLAVLGLAAAATVAIAVLIALTLTPAILSLVGNRIVSKRAWRNAGAAAEKSQKQAADGAQPAESVESTGRGARAELEKRGSGWVGPQSRGARAELEKRGSGWVGPQSRGARAELEKRGSGWVGPQSRGARAELEKRGSGWGGLVTRHPILTLVASIIVLGVVALPALNLRLALPDGGSEPVESSAYQAYHLVGDNFGQGMNGPIVVVGDLPAGLSAEQAKQKQYDVADRLRKINNVKAAVPVVLSDDRRTAVFQVIPAEGPASASTVQVVSDLRADGGSIKAATGVQIGLTGQTAANVDVSNKLGEALPPYLAIVVGLSLILLLLVFRSILVPLLATGGFLLSLAAAFGGVVAVYQWGWLGSFFDVHDPAAVLSFLPIIVIGVLFGLAMDYQVFITSGMRESFAHGETPQQAVRSGFSHAARVVVAAAIIMASVFSGFIFSHLTMIRPLGFALAFGVLLDAFVVRMTIVPAAMHLLGRAAWWTPRWLDRILPDVDVEGAKVVALHEEAATKAANSDASSEEEEPVQTQYERVSASGS